MINYDIVGNQYRNTSANFLNYYNTMQTKLQYDNMQYSLTRSKKLTGYLPCMTKRTRKPCCRKDWNWKPRNAACYDCSIVIYIYCIKADVNLKL